MWSTISFFVSQQKYRGKESSFGFEVRVSPDSWPFLWCPNSTLCARCWLFFTRQKVIGKLGVFACLTATCAHLMSVVIKYSEVIGRYNVSHFPHLINQNSTLDLYLSCFVSVVRGGGINRLEKGYRGLLLCSYYFLGKALPHIEAKTEAAKSGSPPQLVERLGLARLVGWGRRRRRVCTEGKPARREMGSSM